MGRLRRMIANLRGRDLAVGDIHGHFQRLQQCLDAVGFDPAVDRLFSVGDLVDRGPDNEAALEWLAKPWFHAVQGNHEALAITRVRGGKLDLAMYREAGGGWFIDLPRAEQLRFVERFEQLPIAIEVESAAGLVGLLHADSPTAGWSCWMTPKSGKYASGRGGDSGLAIPSRCKACAPCWWATRRCRRPRCWATSGTWTPAAGPAATSPWWTCAA